MMPKDTDAGDGPDGDGVSRRDQRQAVRNRYGSIAAGETIDGAPTTESDTEDSDGCCGGSGGTPAADSSSSKTARESAAGSSRSSSSSSSCCGDDDTGARAQTLGYSTDDLEMAPDDANLGLGCGNPKALADLQSVDTVLDLGAGGGFDCFLAAEEVGSDGHVIGVDMTPAMIERARATAERKGFENVEFRLGEIEALPIPDEHIDVVISNCVINLSPQKRRVFEEAYRVLSPGGRLAISDIAVTPAGRSALDRTDPDQLASCIAGAATPAELRTIAEDAGFESVSVTETDRSEAVIDGMVEESALREALLAATIEGRKPRD